jgi:type VI protein secretion system component Hcp
MAGKKKKSAQASKQGRSAAPKAAAERSKTELDDQELDSVSGGAGKVTMQDFSFVMKVNKASPG